MPQSIPTPAVAVLVSLLASLGANAAPAANDAFANAIPLVGDTLTVVLTEHEASSEPDEPLHTSFFENGQDQHSLWWSWVATRSGTVIIDSWPSREIGGEPLVGDANYITVYTGSHLHDLQLVATNPRVYPNSRPGEDSQPGLLAHTRFHAVVGTRYFLALNAPGDDEEQGPYGRVLSGFSLNFLNDHFLEAAELVEESAEVQGSTVGATMEAGEPHHTVYAWSLVPANSVWWTWQATRGGYLNLSVDKAGDFLVAVYAGDTLNGLVALAGSETGSLGLVVQPGHRYHFVIADANLAEQSSCYTPRPVPGNYTLRLQLADKPPNDDFDQRTVLPHGVRVVHGSNRGASLEPEEPIPAPAADSAAATVWWEWTAQDSQWITFTTLGSDFNTRLTVYSIRDPAAPLTLSNLALAAGPNSLDPSLEFIAPANSLTFRQTSRVSFQAEAGERYFISVDGLHTPGRLNDPQTGSIQLNLKSLQLQLHHLAATWAPGEVPEPIGCCPPEVVFDTAHLLTVNLSVQNWTASVTPSLRVRLVAEAGTVSWGGLSSTNLVPLGILEPGSLGPNSVRSLEFEVTTPFPEESPVDNGCGDPESGRSVKYWIVRAILEVQLTGGAWSPVDVLPIYHTGAGRYQAPTNGPFGGALRPDTTIATRDLPQTQFQIPPGSTLNLDLKSLFNLGNSATATILTPPTSGSLQITALQLLYVSAFEATGWDVCLLQLSEPRPSGLWTEIVLLQFEVALAPNDGFPTENNHFVNALPITAASATIHTSTETMNLEPGEPNHSPYQDSMRSTASRWWTYTPPHSGCLILTPVSASSDFTIALYQGQNLTNLVQLAAVEVDFDFDLDESVRWNVKAGEPYYLAIAEAFVPGGGCFSYNPAPDPAPNFAIQLHLDPAPTNNLLANRTLIPPTALVLTGSNLGADSEPGEPSHGNLAANHSVWWEWTSPESDNVILNTLGSDFNTVLAVYELTAPQGPVTFDNLRQIVSNVVDPNLQAILERNPETFQFTSRVTFPAIRNQRYLIAVDGARRDRVNDRRAGTVRLNFERILLNELALKVTRNDLAPISSTFGDFGRFENADRLDGLLEVRNQGSVTTPALRVRVLAEAGRVSWGGLTSTNHLELWRSDELAPLARNATAALPISLHTPFPELDCVADDCEPCSGTSIKYWMIVAQLEARIGNEDAQWHVLQGLPIYHTGTEGFKRPDLGPFGAVLQPDHLITARPFPQNQVRLKAGEDWRFDLRSQFDLPDDATVTNVTPPSRGSLTYEDLTAIYQAYPNTFGWDAMVLNVITPGSADGRRLTFLVEIRSPPQAQSESLLVVEGGSTSEIEGAGASSLLANETGIDPLALRIAEINGQPLPQDALTLELLHGTLSVDTYGSFTYHHDGSESTLDSFTYRVTDGIELSDPVTVPIHIQPINDPPTAHPDSLIVFRGSTSATLINGQLSLIENDVDPDNPKSDLVTEVHQPPAYGTLTLHGNGSFIYQHHGSTVEYDTFTYTISDGEHTSAPVAVNITVQPPPELIVTNADNSLTITVTVQPDYRYELVTSSNLIDWIPLENIHWITEGEQQIPLIPLPDSSQSFYRLHLIPR